MADETGSVILPRRFTLGNLMSIIATIIVGVFVFGGLWAVLGYKVSDLQTTVAAFPSTYATQVQLDAVQKTTDQIINDQKSSSKDVREAVSKLVDKIGDTNSTISGLAATMNAVQANITDIRRSLEQDRAPLRRRTDPPE